MKVEPVTPTIGAEISGIDMTPDMSDDAVAFVRNALLEHKVVWLKDQHLDGAAITAVATRFGVPTEAHPVEPSLEGHPEVLPLDSTEGARADVWHSDLTFLDAPPLGAFLHALEVPFVGGDTVWADMSAAFTSLSQDLRDSLRTMRAVHSTRKAGNYSAGRDTTGGDAARATEALTASHPVVHVHPETARESLFVNPLFTDFIEGLEHDESDRLLRRIYAASVAPECTVRKRWRQGDLAIWDNRCTMHYALLDFGSAHRRMLRVALEGDRPVGPGS